MKWTCCSRPPFRFLPPVIADLREHPDNLRPQELIMLRNTRPFNVWGIPAISVPCGFTKDGLPIGLQLAAAPWREDVVLQAAHAYEQATEWHTRTPARLNFKGSLGSEHGRG